LFEKTGQSWNREIGLQSVVLTGGRRRIVAASPAVVGAPYGELYQGKSGQGELNDRNPCDFEIFYLPMRGSSTFFFGGYDQKFPMIWPQVSISLPWYGFLTVLSVCSQLALAMGQYTT
jgi:hypothetical protein